MDFDIKNNVANKLTFGRLFRPIFVVFSLYLIGDALYRWDGFSNYASFYEFLPAVGLAFILWSIVALSVTLLVWMTLWIVTFALRVIGLKINFGHLFLCIGTFVLFGALAWKGKKIIWPYAKTSVQVKFIVLTVSTFLSVLLTWLLRYKQEKIIAVIQERITPLVWLFGFLVISSVPLVAYYSFWKTDSIEPLKKPTTAVTREDKPNIILVTFDTLAARHMSAYGYHKETTPFISRWAKKATLFTKVEASSNYTTPAVASLMTGKRVWTHQTYRIAGSKPVRSKTESLPAMLKDYGYFNIALVVNSFASAEVLGMSDSFDIAPPATDFGTSVSLFGWKFGIIDKILYRAFGNKIRLHDWIIRNDFIFSKAINLFSRNIYQTTAPPSKAFNRFLDIVEDVPRPFFAWIHVFPPHDPYLPPAPFNDDRNKSGMLRDYKSQEKLIEESYIYLFQQKPVPGEMIPAINLMRNYYDKFIEYCDNQFEEFIEKLNESILDNTIIILTADHGESFEHGYFTHGGPFLYEQVTNVPLIIKTPNQQNGQIKYDLVEQIDVPASILSFANIPLPSWMEGRSLLPVIYGEDLPSRPAFSVNFERNPGHGQRITTGTIAIWSNEYKLIHYLEQDESLLFNLKNDPDERRNLIDEIPEAGDVLLKTLLTAVEHANERMEKR